MISRSLGLTFSPVRRTGLLFVICFGVAVSGCSVTGTDSRSKSAERTLPDTLDARRVSLADARRAVATPDTVNVAAHVVDYKICPENANCLLTDGVIIADHPDPEEQENTRYIAVDSPRQFVKGDRYLMSLDVMNPRDRTVDENLLALIGYSRLESGRRNPSATSESGQLWLWGIPTVWRRSSTVKP